MNLAVISLRQIFTMIVLMAIGIMSYKINLINDETNKRLSNFVLMLVNPLVIFLSYQRDFQKDLLIGLMISLLLALISFALNIFLSGLLFPNKNNKNRSAERFATIYSNCGFIGIPLVNGLFGSEGVFYITAYMTIFNLLVWTHGIILISGKRDWKSINKALLSPSVIATISGFIFFIVRLQLPDIVLTPLNHLGNTNTPLAMIVAGVSIAQTNIRELLKNHRIFYISFIKLLVFPLIIAALFSLLPFEQTITATSILANACPTATTLIMFAYRYDKNVTYSSQLFAATTILSMITIPFVMLFA
ncbi:MAG TPA: AEC family transporter [Clostridiales bacterium]|nr:AEC family transporter [Clostridiales bacterium]